MPVVCIPRLAAWGITFRPMHALSRAKARVPACGLPQVCPMAPFPRSVPPDEGARRPRHPCAPVARKALSGYAADAGTPAARRSGQARNPALPGHEHRIDRHQRNP